MVTMKKIAIILLGGYEEAELQHQQYFLGTVAKTYNEL